MSNASSKLQPAGPAIPELNDQAVPSSTGAAWNPWLGLTFVFALFFGSQLFSSVVLSLYASLRLMTATQANNWLTNSVPAQFFFILLAEATIVVGVYLFIRGHKQTLAVIGIRRPRWSDPLYGVAMLVPYFVVLLIATAVAQRIFPSLNVNETQQLGFNNVQGSGNLLLTFASLVILPPIGEEILVRGLLYSTLKKAAPLGVAALITSALFASAHLPEGGAAGPLWIAAIDTFILSFALIYLREKTGGLWGSMTLHALKNGIAFAVLFGPHLR
jgi:membrane protease YdiL (CAAX protease family)